MGTFCNYNYSQWRNLLALNNFNMCMYACYCKTTRLQFGISGHWYWQTEQFRGQTIPINTSETQHGLGTKTTVMSMLKNIHIQCNNVRKPSSHVYICSS